MEKESNLSAYKVIGNNMDNGKRTSFESGDKIIAKFVPVNEFRNSINDDLNSFWVITIEGSCLIRQITRYDEDNDMIICHALNPGYKDIVIRVDRIDEIRRVIYAEHKIVSYPILK